MTGGTARVGEAWMPFLIGPPGEGLGFAADGGGKEIRLLGPCEERRAVCCPRCGTILIDGPGPGSFPDGTELLPVAKKEGKRCPACGAPVPEGETECPRCASGLDAAGSGP